jgi:U3 small nucleolar RNA-associated protein 4
MPGPEAPLSINPYVKRGSATFEEAYYYRAPFTMGVTSVASAARLVACRYDDRVAVWKIYQGAPVESTDEIGNGRSGWEGVENADSPNTDESGWSKMLEMQLKVETNLSAIALSPEGVHLAVSDLYDVKLFLLNQVSLDHYFSLILRRLASFSF